MRTRNLWDFPRLMKGIILGLFQPLMKYEHQLVQCFFRAELSDEATNFRNTIEEAEPYGVDVFLRGVRGGGKTNFLKWFLRTPRYSKDMLDRHLFIDLRTIHSLRREDVFESRVREILTGLIKEYFQKQKDASRASGHGLEMSFRRTYELAVKRILKHREGKKPLLLFLDDIDYSDQFLPNLLRLTKDFRQSSQCVVIQAVRNPAYNAIMTSADYPIGEVAVAQRLDPVDLPLFGPQQILSRRLSLICDEKKIGLRKKIEGNRLIELVAGLSKGISNFFREGQEMQDLEKGIQRQTVQTIKLPFSHLQYEFIDGMGNGNINYIEVLGKEMMECLRKNRSKLTEVLDGYSVPDQAILDHFVQTRIERIQIRNLHMEVSHKRMSGKRMRERKIEQHQIENSLYVVLLEFLMDKSSIGPTDTGFFEEYGFKEEALKPGLTVLFDMELINEEVISYEKALGGPDAQSSKEYYVTPRGKYYLRSLLHWPEYINAFGQSRHHRSGRIHPQAVVAKDLLLDFVMKIFITKEGLGEEETEFKINKENFLRNFLSLYEQAIRRLFLAGPNWKRQINIKDITIWLSDLKIIEISRVKEYDNYLFYEAKTRLACKTRGMWWSARAPYDKHLFRDIARKLTKTPESYTYPREKSKEK